MTQGPLGYKAVPKLSRSSQALVLIVKRKFAEYLLRRVTAMTISLVGTLIFGLNRLSVPIGDDEYQWEMKLEEDTFSPFFISIGGSDSYRFDYQKVSKETTYQ